MTTEHPHHKHDGKAGSVLFMVMALLAGLSFIGATIFLVTKTDLQITANFKTEVTAFQHADAGVQFVKDAIDQALGAGTLTLLNPVETVNYTAPSGYTFDPVTQLTQTGNTNAYVFEVTGRFQDAEATVEAVVHRRPLMEFGLFGDEQVDLKAYANVYSYNSVLLSNPGPGDSDGTADTASNEEFISHMGTIIDGSLALGEDLSGTPAIWQTTGSPDISGEEGIEISRVDPDPLGAVGGALEQDFTDASSVNDNGSAIPPIPANNMINLGNGETLTLPAGDYYIESFILKNGATLDIDASAGPVTVYLAGGMEAKTGSAINTGNDPTDFLLYSNSDQRLALKHDGEFRGLIYAPDAFVEIKNTADFYGIAWGETVEMKNSGDVYIDTALLNRFWDDSVYLVSWKDIRR